MHDALVPASELLESGQFDQAIQQCEKVLSDAPNNVAALKLLAIIHYQRNDYTASADLLTKAAQLQPDDVEVYISLSEVYRNTGEIDKAIEACNKALALVPNSPEAINNLGMALCGQGKFDEAIEQFQLALQICAEFSAAHNNLGMALVAQEHFDDALIQFRKAVECDPTSAFALANLSQLLLASHRPDQALLYGEEAVRLEPNNARIHCNLAAILRDLGREEEARLLYRKVGQLDPGVPEALAKSGLFCQWNSRYDEALRLLEQASEIEPENTNYLFYLAKFHEELNEWSDAAIHWKRIIDVTPTSPGAHANLAGCLLNGESFTEALEEYQTAIDLDPKCVVAHIGLSNAKTQMGDLTGAENILRNLSPIAPVAVQAELAHLLGGKLPEPDFVALQKYVSLSGDSDDCRTRLLAGLAHVHDGRGDYHLAAQIMSMVNDFRLREAKERKQEYKRADFEDFVDAIIRSCGIEFFSRLSGHGLDTRRPVFVFGFPRSGTTLVEQILASHSSVHAAGELDLAAKSFRSMPRVTQRANRPLDCLPLLNDQAILNLGRAHLMRLQLIDNGRAERIVDKLPDNYVYLGLLAAMFPNGVFIHCRRNPRDIAVSCWLINFRSLPYTLDFRDLAHRITQYHRIMEHWRKVLPISIHEVQYEKLVDDFEDVSRSLIGACGLEWEDGCLNFQKTRRQVMTASITQVRQPIYRNSVGRWKHYERELSDLFAMLPS